MTLSSPRVVIVVVTWNGLRDTLDCLVTLRWLDYANYQIVLVDNASKDGTLETVRCRFPEVEVIANATNTGYVHANNQGIAWALEHSADWILLLNNDVIMEPGTLTEMIRVGESAPDTGIVGPAMQRTLRPDLTDLGGDLDFRWGRVLLRQYAPSLNGHDMLPIGYVWGCTLMARHALGGFDMFWIIGGCSNASCPSSACTAIPCKPLRQDTSFSPSFC